MEDLLKQLLESQQQLFEGQNQLFEGQKQLVEAQKQLFDGQKQLFDGQRQIFTSLNRLDDELTAVKSELTTVRSDLTDIKSDIPSKAQQNENTRFIDALVHRTEELNALVTNLGFTSAKLEGMLANTATKEDVADLSAQLGVLNNRIFRQETEIKKLKVVK